MMKNRVFQAKTLFCAKKTKNLQFFMMKNTVFHFLPIQLAIYSWLVVSKYILAGMHTYFEI